MASVQYASESFVARIIAGLNEWSFSDEGCYTRREKLNFLPEMFFGEIFGEEWKVERGRGGIRLYIGGKITTWNDDETGREMVNAELRALIRAKIYENNADARLAFGIQE